MGDEFIKIYVCLHNKWNPYSEENKNMPVTYWVTAFNFIRLQKKDEWDNLYKPLAEMIGQLTHPDIYKEYEKIKNKQAGIDDMEVNKDYYKETSGGRSGGGTAGAKFDPVKGLVDMNGNVIVSKEQYQNSIGLDGVAISY